MRHIELSDIGIDPADSLVASRGGWGGPTSTWLAHVGSDNKASLVDSCNGHSTSPNSVADSNVLKHSIPSIADGLTGLGIDEGYTLSTDFQASLKRYASHSNLPYPRRNSLNEEDLGKPAPNALGEKGYATSRSDPEESSDPLPFYTPQQGLVGNQEAFMGLFLDRPGEWKNKFAGDTLNGLGECEIENSMGSNSHRGEAHSELSLADHMRTLSGELAGIQQARGKSNTGHLTDLPPTYHDVQAEKRTGNIPKQPRSKPLLTLFYKNFTHQYGDTS